MENLRISILHYSLKKHLTNSHNPKNLLFFKNKNKMKTLKHLFYSIGISLLCLATVHADPLPEGVYTMPDGTVIIVDLTAPTGSIFAAQDKGGNAQLINGLLCKKPLEKVKIAITHQDFFQNYGTFKSWAIMGKTGTRSAADVTVCDFSAGGGYTHTIGTGTNYNPFSEVVEDGVQPGRVRTIKPCPPYPAYVVANESAERKSYSFTESGSKS